MSIITSIVFLFVLLNILSVLDGKEKGCQYISRKAPKKVSTKKIREDSSPKNKNKKAQFPEDWDI